MDKELKDTIKELEILHRELVAFRRSSPTQRSLEAKAKLDDALSLLRRSV